MGIRKGVPRVNIDLKDYEDIEEAERLREALIFIHQQVHQAHHDGPIEMCKKTTCVEAAKALNEEPKKKKYYVGVQEVHVSTREVFAVNEDEAVKMAGDGDSEEVMCEYSHTLDKELWSVEEVK